MITYINGAINEAIGKARALMFKIPGARDLGVYFPSLATTAQREIDQILLELDYLYSDADYNDPRNIRRKYQRFKQLSGKLSEIENVVIAAMSRKASDDEFVNKLLLEICREINYPLQTPVASCLSQRYYHIYPQYNLICIPLLESEFVLHLADIYHELGHPLMSFDTNPKVEAFQKNLGYFNIEVRKYFDDEIKRRELAREIDKNAEPIYVWKDCWLEKWSSELFCDLFATFTLGAAYLWSNLHMCAKMSWDVFKVPTFQKTSHPPGEARMRAALHGLELIGFKAEKAEIEKKWVEFKAIIGQKESAEFSVALPDNLLKRAAEFCLTGTRQIGCEIAGNPGHQISGTSAKVNPLLNDSWKQFWKEPELFHHWERKALQDFKKSL
jgi:hypothetical protein